MVRPAPLFLAGAQYVAALAMGPSYLGKGFDALLAAPWGAPLHLAALALTLAALVSHAPGSSPIRTPWRQQWPERKTAPYASES